MQVIYSNAASIFVNNNCPADNRAALYAQIAQQAQNLAVIRDNPERYDTEAKAFTLPVQDQRWPAINFAKAYVSAMRKTGIIWTTYVGTQIMVISFNNLNADAK